MRLAKISLERAQRLFAAQVISKQDFDTAQSNYDAAAAQLKSLDGAGEAAESGAALLHSERTDGRNCRGYSGAHGRSRDGVDTADDGR